MAAVPVRGTWEVSGTRGLGCSGQKGGDRGRGGGEWAEDEEENEAKEEEGGEAEEAEGAEEEME